jgi:hypothetical protein
MEPAKTTRDALLADLEDLWQKLDALIGSLKPGDWSRRHGKDWTFADVPYHLSYFDRDIVANPIERGPNVPADEQRVLRSTRELDAWNARKFAERPVNQTPEQSVEQMHASHDAIRRIIGKISDADLSRPVFIHLPGCGWLTARFALEACRAHTWSHFLQLRLHMKRDRPVPSLSVTHGALAFYMGFFPMTLNRAQAAKTPFTLVMEFTGLGGGAWTVRVADGACTVREERAPQADLVMMQSPETFLKTLAEMHNPMVAMLTKCFQSEIAAEAPGRAGGLHRRSRNYNQQEDAATIGWKHLGR